MPEVAKFWLDGMGVAYFEFWIKGNPYSVPFSTHLLDDPTFDLKKYLLEYISDRQ